MFILSIVFLIVVATVLFVLVQKKGVAAHPQKQTPVNAKEIIKNNDSSYERKDFLTKKERDFFFKLNKELKNEYNLLAQVRVADVIKPSTKYPTRSKEYNALFRQISQWHIDYAILNNTTFEIVAAIELDDSTHQQPKRIQRDKTLNDAFRQAQIPLLRTMSYDSFKQSHGSDFLN